jgi:hypothetical protein
VIKDLRPLRWKKKDKSVNQGSFFLDKSCREAILLLAAQRSSFI